MRNAIRTWGWMACGAGLCLFAGCASPKPAATTDPELSRVAGVARLSFEQGSLEQSARLYARALRMARKTDDAREIGSNAYNLAACLAELGRYPEALGFLEEARGEFARAERSQADLLLLEARIALLSGQFSDALAIAEQVLPAAAKGNVPSYRVQVMLLRADVALARGAAEVARVELDDAKKDLQKQRDALLNAQAAGVEGRVLLATGAPADAAKMFDRQAGLLKSDARFREMALTLARAGEAYQQAEAFTKAGDRFYRAARSLYAQGDQLEALKMIQAALAAAEKSGDEKFLKRIATLFEEVRHRVESVKKPPAESSNEQPGN